MSTTKKLLSIALAVLLTAGWGGCGQIVKTPKVILTPVETPMKLSDDVLKLLGHCPVTEKNPNDNSVLELYRVQGANKLSLKQCNEDKKGLRKALGVDK